MSLPTFIFALLVVSCAVAAPRALAVRELAGNDAIAVEAAMVSRHEKWMAEHGRTYADEEEKARRLEVFLANAKFIDSFNALTVSSGEHGLEGHGRRHRRQGPRLLRLLLGVLGGGGGGRADQDPHGAAYVTVGAAAGGLRRERRRRGLRRRPHGQRLRVHGPPRRPHHGVVLPVPRHGRVVPPLGLGRVHPGVRGRAGQQRGRADGGRGAPARVRGHQRRRQRVPVLRQRRAGRVRLRHGAQPRHHGGRVRHGGRRHQVLDHEELVGRVVGRGRLRQDPPRRARRGRLRPRPARVLPCLAR
ncbi:hypothetical protein VPH35_092527 [Triticum aestivum]